MASLSIVDLRRVLRFLELAGDHATAADPLPRPTLAALGDLIPADAIYVFELRRSDRATLAFSSDHDLQPVAGSDAALDAFGHQNPLRWRRWGPADGVLRMSEVSSRRALERLAFYQTYLRPNRIRDTLKIWLSSTRHSAVCVCLDRAESDFSPRDAALLGVLHEHLAAIRHSAQRPLPSPGAPLTPREAQVLTWAAMGERNEEIASRLFVTPATVRKHLERGYAKIAVRSRTEAAAALLFSRRVAGHARSGDDEPIRH